MAANARAPAPPKAGANLRRAFRYGCGPAVLTRLTLPATGGRVFAFIHDLSARGVGLELLFPLDVGAEIVFYVKGDGPAAREDLRAEVVHCSWVDGLHRIGCRFPTPLAPAHLAAILGRMRREASHGQAASPPPDAPPDRS